MARKPRVISRWVLARKIVQGAALAIFLMLFIGARRGGFAPELSNLAMRISPLAMLAHLLSSRTFLAGSAVALILVILALVAGRAWCGWLCPLGTLLDLFPLRRWNRQPPAINERWRTVKYSLLIAILVAALFGNLTLLIFDPLTLFIRSLTLAILPALDQITRAVLSALANIPAMEDPVAALNGWLRPVVLPGLPLYFRDALLFGAVFFGVIALNLFAPRFWCRYLCPLGALLGWISRVAFFRRQVVNEDCKGCALCERACPTGTIDPHRNFASDPAECTLCMECLPACPRSSVGFTGRLSLGERQPYDPDRRAVMGSFAAAIAAIALFRGARPKHDPSHRIRPPGVVEDDLLTHCVRCGECMRACPTAAIQPARLEAGLEGLWTPVLDMRLGYCDFSCNACGQICPVQAIPPLTLNEKRETIIGKAYIDQNRCIAWADHIDCIICEEMCPLPDKAIHLEETSVALPDGGTVIVKLPHVLRDVCIGCGICEYRCPLNGDAAIRIYVPDKPVLI